MPKRPDPNAVQGGNAARRTDQNGDEPQLLYRFPRDLYTDVDYVNNGTVSAETQLSFGGTKAAGGHREVGQQTLDSFNGWKST